MSEIDTWLVFATVLSNLVIALLSLIRSTRNGDKLEEVHHTAKEAGYAADRAFNEANDANRKIAQVTTLAVIAGLEAKIHDATPPESPHS